MVSKSSNYFFVLDRNALQERHVAGGSLYKPQTRNFGRLNFSSLDALRIYEIMYNSRHKLYLKRKKDVFDRFIKLRE